MEFIPPLFRAKSLDNALQEEKAVGLLTSNDSLDEFFINHWVDTSGLTESGYVEYDGYYLEVLIDVSTLEVSFDDGVVWRDYFELQEQLKNIQ